MIPRGNAPRRATDFRHQRVKDICRELGIISGGVISADSPAILISLFPQSGAVGASLAINAAEKEAWKQDNRKKLGAAKMAARHLVVYLDATNGLAWVALMEFDPPNTVPILPEEITHLWIVGGGEKRGEFVVWYASTGEPWLTAKVSLDPLFFA